MSKNRRRWRFGSVGKKKGERAKFVSKKKIQMPASAYQLKSPSTIHDLLESMEQLGTKELAIVAQKVSLLQAKRRVPSLSAEESELLLKINEGLTEEEWNRYYNLVEKRQDETIGKQELKELIGMTERLEFMNARRLECVYQLAQLRNVPVEKLIKQLGIYKPFNVL